MQVVWKTAVSFGDDRRVSVPAGSRPVHFAQQGDGLFLWWAVPSPHAPKQSRRVRVAGTGHEVDDHLSYVGTVLLGEGSLVYHAFVEDESARG